MFGMSRNPVASYAQVSQDIAVETADPHKLILMLFEGARAAIWIARAHMERKEIAEKGAAISKAIDIVNNGLLASLDMNQGEIAERLASLYQYISYRLVWGNLNNNLAALDEANQLLGELHSAWTMIAPNANKQAAA
jgi:flagellar protein FliS